MRILLVTQDRDARERMASAIGIEPQVLFADCAASGREALACLAARRPEVLFVRLPLPDMNGVEFVRAAKRVLASCQILLIAPAGTEEALIAALEAGAAGCVLEPCDAHELVGHALKLRAGGSPLSPFVARKLVERLHARTLAHAAAVALTARESDVVCLLASGLSYSQIGDRLGVSLNTVGSHIKNAYRKLDVHSATAAVMRAVELQMPGKA
ncbi:MAG: response regulator transcription factor [Betaproteobacteria bacterium]|nr:MAG: response regulator transcription factor [Betaproteobacteria bacterium]